MQFRNLYSTKDSAAYIYYVEVCVGEVKGSRYTKKEVVKQINWHLAQQRVNGTAVVSTLNQQQREQHTYTHS